MLLLAVVAVQQQPRRSYGACCPRPAACRQLRGGGCSSGLCKPWPTPLLLGFEAMPGLRVRPGQKLSMMNGTASEATETAAHEDGWQTMQMTPS